MQSEQWTLTLSNRPFCERSKSQNDGLRLTSPDYRMSLG